MDLYHFQVGFPKWFTKPTGVVQPTYGQHSRDEAAKDRYGQLMLPSSVDLAKAQVIELGVEGNKVVKMLLRMPMDATRDLCMVLTNTGYVKTVWCNLRSDSHRTLDRTKYKNP